MLYVNVNFFSKIFKLFRAPSSFKQQVLWPECPFYEAYLEGDLPLAYLQHQPCMLFVIFPILSEQGLICEVRFFALGIEV